MDDYRMTTIKREYPAPCYHIEWDENGFGKVSDMPTDISVPGWGERSINKLLDEIDICRSAIEACYDMVQSLDCYTDMDVACQRATLRQLNEAVGKATPKLLKERPEGQKLYGLHYHELRAEIEQLQNICDWNKIIANQNKWIADKEVEENQELRATILRQRELLFAAGRQLTSLNVCDDVTKAITALQADPKEKS